MCKCKIICTTEKHCHSTILKYHSCLKGIFSTFKIWNEQINFSNLTKYITTCSYSMIRKYVLYVVY